MLWEGNPDKDNPEEFTGTQSGVKNKTIPSSWDKSGAQGRLRNPKIPGWFGPVTNGHVFICYITQNNAADTAHLWGRLRSRGEQQE